MQRGDLWLYISSVVTYSGLFSTVTETFLLIFKEYCVLYNSWGLFSIITHIVTWTFKVISCHFEFLYCIFTFILHVFKQWWLRTAFIFFPQGCALNKRLFIANSIKLSRSPGWVKSWARDWCRRSFYIWVGFIGWIKNLLWPFDRAEI